MTFHTKGCNIIVLAVLQIVESKMAPGFLIFSLSLQLLAGVL